MLLPPRKYWLIGILSMLSLRSVSQIQLNNISEFTFLNELDYWVFEDSTGSLQLHDIQRLPDSAWTHQHYLKNFHSTYWLRFDLQNQGESEKKWVLELIDPHINDLTFYSPKTPNPERQGYLRPFSARKYRHKNHVFDLHVREGKTTYYFELHSNSHIAFAPKLQTNSYFSGYSLHEYFFLGLFYGFLVILCLYHLILFSFTRLSARIFFVLYLLSAIINATAEDGLGFHFLWPEAPWINHVIPVAPPLIYLLCFLLYSATMLDLKKKRLLPLYFYVPSYLIFHLICFLVELPTRIWVPFYLVPFAYILVLALTQKRKTSPLNRLLSLGTFLIFLSYFIFYLRTNNWVPNSVFVVYFFNFSLTIEAILFSIAIGEKLRDRQREHLHDKELVIMGLMENERLKDKVNRELEAKVASRTTDLQEAKQRLEAQAEEIQRMNLALDLSNRALSQQVEEVSKKRVHGTALEPDEFHALYPDKLKCLQFLEELKWKKGFACRKCGHTQFAPGTSFRSRRCTKCGTVESPTAHTLFHGLRIPLEDAFYIFALVVQSKGAISTNELEKRTGVGQKACWRFKQKVVERMEGQKEGQFTWDQLIYQS